MPKREYKHTARFTATARCVLEPDKGKHLSLASITDLKTILPPGYALNADLLPVAGNLFVANLGNGNGDIMGTEESKALAGRFVHKFINVEHDRDEIIGFVTNASLTKFSPNFATGSGSEELKAEDFTGSDPFNVSVGGYIWKTVASNLAEQLEESNDPKSDKYLTISFSWEVSFDEYKILKGASELSDAQGTIITDEVEVARLTKKLISKGGKGKDDDGAPLYRLIVFAKKEDGSIDLESITPQGIALTLNPAAAVQGVVVPTKEIESAEASKKENLQNIENKISQTEQASVIHTRQPMKVLKNLKELATLNDETIKEYSVANIGAVVDAGLKAELQTEITKTVSEYDEKLKAEKDAAVAAKKAEDEAKAAQVALKADFDKLTKELQELKDAQAVEAQASKFNQRMSYLDGEYELTDPQKKALASRIKGMSDDEFKSYQENEAVAFLVKKGKKEEGQASTDNKNAGKTAAELALASAKPEGTVTSQPTTQQSLADQFSEAFKDVTITESKRAKK